MQKTAILVLLLFSALSFAQYSQTLCSGCGEPAPEKCTGLNITELPCSLHAASFSCQVQKTMEGWMICPVCPEGYSFLRCDSSWIFGIHKWTRCASNYAVSCGSYCQEGDNVLSREECSLPRKRLCCEIPSNSVSIRSPQNNANLSVQENASFSITYNGTVKNITIDYGDGNTDWKPSNPNNLVIFTHGYLPGAYSVNAFARTCENCTYQYISNSSINITIG